MVITEYLPKPMIKITTIASSSSGNCYLLDNGKSKLVIEAGISIAKIKEAMGFQLSSSAGCLVSHGHGDHAKAVKDMMIAGVDVFMSKGAAEQIGATGHRMNHVQALQQFTVGGWTVLPFDVVHDAEEPLGFIIASGDEKVLFITDLAYCKYRFSGVTHLMIEANFCEKILAENVASGLVEKERCWRIIKSHMSIQRVVDLLRQMDKSRLKEIHLLHLSSANSHEAMFKKLVAETTGKTVYVG